MNEIGVTFTAKHLMPHERAFLSARHCEIGPTGTMKISNFHMKELVWMKISVMRLRHE